MSKPSTYTAGPQFQLGLTSTTTSNSKTLNANASAVYLQAVNGDVLVSFDGVAPTTTSGAIYLPKAQPPTLFLIGEGAVITVAANTTSGTAALNGIPLQ